MYFLLNNCILSEHKGLLAKNFFLITNPQTFEQ